jgi:hypothetical protein
MKPIKKIQIGDTIYTARVDFRTAIECNRIASDSKINDFERPLAIICTMFGAEGLDHPEHYEKLLGWILSYLSCGKEPVNEEADMDYIKDMDYIETSFMSDYGIDLENSDMEWRKFFNLLNGLSNSELGNCCILNRIRNLRNFDLSEIKDSKERDKIRKAKESVALHKKEDNLTKEQEERLKMFNEIARL